MLELPDCCHGNRYVHVRTGRLHCGTTWGRRVLAAPVHLEWDGYSCIKLGGGMPAIPLGLGTIESRVSWDCGDSD